MTSRLTGFIIVTELERKRDMEKLKIRLKSARVNAELTQTEVAKSMKVSLQTIVNWEKGRTEPTLRQGRALSRLYGIPLDNIFLPEESSKTGDICYPTDTR